jgi:trk system potassium uptake protein
MGKNPAKIIVAGFIGLIAAGTILLMLPGSTTGENIGFIDAFFTAASATCLTGLTVHDTGTYFSYRGQLVILTLIQMGALGIMIFGAVFALMIRQAWSVREPVIQDMLKIETGSRIGKMIVFILLSTAVIELFGAMCLMNTWPHDATGINHGAFFISIFHSVSAFANSGFALFPDSLAGLRYSWGIYLIICPLIILGGLGFTVLYDISSIIFDRTRRALYRKFKPTTAILERPPKRFELQTRIVLIVSAILVAGGAAMMLLFENIMPQTKSFGVLDALFQSITARTAGFTTVDTDSLSAPSIFIITLLMLIGGSPGSAAGGMKTVTVAIIVMTVWTTLRKRSEVEIFNRAVPLVVVGRAITIVLMFLLTLFTITLLLCITELHSGFTMGQLFFESASALGAAGLSAGITSSLTTAGKMLIILAMLIGRLGSLTLLTSLTLNMRSADYSYPKEPVMVG